MNNNKGISLISLSIYVLVATIVVGILTFMNANFFSKVSEASSRTELMNEYAKFISVFLKDLKSSEKVIEYTSTKIKFSDNVSYEIKAMKNEDGTIKEYAIFRDSVKVCKGIHESDAGVVPAFDYDYLENTVAVTLAFNNDNYEWLENGVYQVGRGY